MMKTLTLYEANMLVRSVIDQLIPDGFWIQAELSEVRSSRGHCYMELVETDGNRLLARASAKCWASTWALLRPHFERVTGQQLAPGMKVMLQARPQFHEAYGFSWIVDDINPEFTLGDQMRRRQEIIRQLKDEGVFDLQKELRLPVFAQRIAVISAETAAGYGDFCNQLCENPYGFHFHVELFPAVMQGEKVEQSIIDALNRIYDSIECPSETEAGTMPFDCVVIIRGGGATTDLSGFDTLALAENVANFPLPIITGIGHDRDESILDMVSHTRVKTPTAAATFLIDHLAQVAERLDQLTMRIPQLVRQRFLFERHRLEGYDDRMRQSLRLIFERQHHRLETISYRLRALDPQLVLSRGYSITLKDGKVIRDPSAIKVGEVIETRLEKGSVRSRVEK